MSERYVKEGRLGEQKDLALKLKIKLEGLRDQIRNHLDPFEDVAALKLENVVVYAVEARKIQGQLAEARGKISDILKSLGREPEP